MAIPVYLQDLEVHADSKQIAEGRKKTLLSALATYIVILSILPLLDSHSLFA